MKVDKKISWNFSGPRGGIWSRRSWSSARSADDRPPRPNPPPRAREVSTFFFDFHEYHKWFSSFLCKIFVNTAKNIKKINEYQVTKIKKICAVYVEILLWWYLGQKYSFIHLQSNVSSYLKHSFVLEVVIDISVFVIFRARIQLWSFLSSVYTYLYLKYVYSSIQSAFLT